MATRGAPQSDSSSPAGTPTRHAYRVGFIVATTSVIICIVLLPVAIASLLAARSHPVGTQSYDLTRPSKLTGEWTKLNIAATSVNEADETITLRVSGFHDCPKGCSGVERAQFFSVHADPSGAFGAPPSVTIDLPADSSEVNQVVTLPLSGDLIDYPFDHYTVLLGVAFSQVSPSGATSAILPLAATHRLEYSIDDAMPRLSLSAPTVRSPASYDTTGAVYETVTSLTFFRPAYLRVLTVLLTLLIILAAAYGVLIRPFTQIIPTVGGLVLGVWGIRSLLVGSYPPDSTGVDLVLETAILFLLLAVALRAVWFMWSKAELKRGPTGGGAEAEADHDDDLELPREEDLIGADASDG